MKINWLRRRSVRAGAAAAIGISLLIGLSGQQVQAASTINVYWVMTNNQSGSPSNLWHNMWITVQLPMSQSDAQAYIWGGARVEIMCYGDDFFFDDSLLRSPAVYTGWTGDRYSLPGTDNTIYTGVNRLYANSYGVILTAIISGKHGHSLNTNLSEGFNEDLGTDEVYCKATWIGGGSRLAAFTGVVSGDF